jgi:PHD/YefM family antitoxin component YafN of YafNO toxin-antitoxin module
MAKTTQIDLNDIRSVTDFQRNAKQHIGRLRRSKTPMVLTVNGAASVVVQDATAYQAMVEEIGTLRESQRFIAAVSEGVADFESGRSKPWRKAFAESEKRIGIRR